MENPEELHQYCLNCGKHLPEGASYCPACSQKVTDGKVSIKEFFFEFLDTFFNLDSRIWRTLRDIWIPGKLTLQYFLGKHKTYMHPLRLFFILGLIHFAIISYRAGNLASGNLSEFPNSIKTAQVEKKYFNEIDSIRRIIEKEHNNLPIVKEAFDSLILKVNPGLDTASEETKIFFPGITNDKGESVGVKITDCYKYDFEEIKTMYNVDGFLSILLLKQFHLTVTEPDKVYRSFMANLIWMVLLMMPVIALVLKLFYFRKGMYFVEHLVFSFHFHAFSFLVISPFYLFLTESNLEYILVPLFIILIYLLVMIKRYYQQGWIKTFFKWWFLINCYGILIGFYLLGALFISFLLV